MKQASGRLPRPRSAQRAAGERSPIRLALAVTTLFLLLPTSASHAQWLLDDPALRVLSPEDLASRPARFPFPVGERLEYAVSWFGVPAGTAVIEIARFVALGDQRYAHVVATARTNAVFSVLHLIDDRSEAWIDLDRFVTVRTRALERRPGKLYDESVRYDWSTHFLHARLDKQHKGQRREIALDFGPHAHDTSDVVYALRALPLAPGRSFGLPTYASRKLFELRIDVAAGPPLASEPFGTVETLAVQPSMRLDGRTFAAGDGVVYVTGAARVPIRLDGWIRTSEQSFLLQGLRAVLTGYTASAPGWSSRHEVAWAVPAAMPPTQDGVPQWEPPPAVRTARAKAGVAVGETLSRIPLPVVSAE